MFWVIKEHTLISVYSVGLFNFIVFYNIAKVILALTNTKQQSDPNNEDKKIETKQRKYRWLISFCARYFGLKGTTQNI